MTATAKKRRGMGSHQQPNKGLTDSWITPRAIVESLGEFDLDPCQCVPQPWPLATQHYTVEHDGLRQPWFGRVWLNPPYSTAGDWLDRLGSHGDGIALIFARTETAMFRRCVWEQADGLLFIHGRLHFHHPDGTKAAGNSGAPSVLVAYGESNVDALRVCGIPGALVTDWKGTDPE